MNLSDLQKLYTQNNLGQFTIYTEPGENTKYILIPGAGNMDENYFKIDDATLASLDQSKLAQGGPRYSFNSSGISTEAFNNLEGVITNGQYSPGGYGGQTNIFEAYANSLKAQKQVQAEEQRVQQLNDAIKVGDKATVERLSPGFTIWNGAFVDASKIPQLEAEGATVKDGNVVGSSLPQLTPEQVAKNTTATTGTANVPGGTNGTDISKVVRIARQGDTFMGVYADSTLHPLTEAQAFSGGLGINADFVKSGTTVSLNQAKTGQSDSGGTGSGTGSGGTGTGSGSGGTGGAGGGQGGGGGTSGTSTSGFDYKLAGIEDADWNAMSPAQRSVIEGAWKVGGQQYDEGLASVSINTKLLNDALAWAEKDPDIVAKYGDALKFDMANVTNSLAVANKQWASDMGLLATKQDIDRKALAEKEAEAGRAFSGFRQRASGQLATDQSGVIESSRRGIEKSVRDLGQGLEQKYGTSGLGQFGNLSLGFGSQQGISGFNSTYSPLGGITGTVDPARRAEILAKGTSIFDLQKLPT